MKCVFTNGKTMHVIKDVHVHNQSLCRGQECGPLFVMFFMHRSTVLLLDPNDIKVI